MLRSANYARGWLYFLYFTTKDWEKAYKCICWTRETESEKACLPVWCQPMRGMLSRCASTSHSSVCLANRGGQRFSWLVRVFHASRFRACLLRQHMTKTRPYTYIYFVNTSCSKRRALFYSFVQSARHRSQRALESVAFVCVVIANVYTTWAMFLFPVILRYVNITKKSIGSGSKRPRREHGSIQSLRTESQFIVLPAKAGTHKTPLGWLFTLVNTTDLLTSALSCRIFSKLQKFYLPFLTCSYQSSSTENRQQSCIFIKQLLVL